MDVKNDEKYACLMNCLKGYYMYVGDEEDDDEEIDN